MITILRRLVKIGVFPGLDMKSSTAIMDWYVKG